MHAWAGHTQASGEPGGGGGRAGRGSPLAGEATGLRRERHLVLEDSERQQAGEGPGLRSRHRLAPREQVGHREPDNVEEAQRAHQLGGVVLVLDARQAKLAVDVAQIGVHQHIVRSLERHERLVTILVVASRLPLVRVQPDGGCFVALVDLLG